MTWDRRSTTAGATRAVEVHTAATARATLWACTVYSSIFVLCPNGPKPHCVLSYNGPRNARSNQYPTSSHTTRSGQCPHSIGLYTE